MYDNANPIYASKANTSDVTKNYSAATSLKMNNEDNVRRFMEKIKNNDYINDANSRRLIGYINQRNAMYEIDRQENIGILPIKKAFTPSPCHNNNYSITKESNTFVQGKDQQQQCNGNYNTNYSQSQGRPIILPHKSNYMNNVNTVQGSHEYKTENYFLNKVVNEQDYSNHNYIDYLQGKIKRCQPNPYNTHCDYLGNTNLTYNTIINPTVNYKHNKCLFRDAGNRVLMLR